MTSTPHDPTATVAGHTWSARGRRWALALISLATLMVAMDTAIVAVALPSAQHALGIPDTARQWVLVAYTLSYGGLLLLGGRLADRLGHRRTLLVGAVGFVCASALSGAALSGPMLFAGRALQGAFGALLVPASRSMLVLIFDEPEERARAMGIYAAVLIGGAVFGFILSGLVTSYLDWRWTLYLNVPVALVVAVGVVRLMPEFAGDPSVRIDVPGVLLGSGGMVAFVYGLSEAAAAGWTAPQVMTLLWVAAALLGAFVYVEHRARGPLLPLRVVRDRDRAGAFVALALQSFANFGMLLVLTYELQVVLSAPPLLTGAALVPWAIANALGAAVIGPRLMRRLPARVLLTAGLFLLAGGLALLARLSPVSGYVPLILATELAMGFGAGLNGTPAIYTALSATPTADTGVTSAMSSTSNQIGASIGTAALSTIAAGASASFLAAHPQATSTAALVAGFTTATALGSGVVLVGALLVATLVRSDPVRPAAS